MRVRFCVQDRAVGRGYRGVSGRGERLRRDLGDALQAHGNYQSVNPTRVGRAEVALVVGVIENDTAAKFAGAAGRGKTGFRLVFSGSRKGGLADLALSKVGRAGLSHYFCNVMAVSDPVYPVITGFSKSATPELLERFIKALSAVSRQHAAFRIENRSQHLALGSRESEIGNCSLPDDSRGPRSFCTISTHGRQEV